MAIEQRTDPRVRRTRALITDAFGALMQERGFGALTVQHIAERAGINRATFYAHFEDKVALFDQVVRELIRADLGRQLPPPAQFKLDDLPLLVRVVFESLSHINGSCGPRQEAVTTPAIETIVHDEVHGFVRSWLQTRKAQASRKATPIDTAALVVSAGMIGAGLSWSRAAKRAPLSQVVREFCDLITPGLA